MRRFRIKLVVEVDAKNSADAIKRFWEVVDEDHMTLTTTMEEVLNY